MRTYSQNKHNFFNQLVTFMESYITIGLGLIAQKRGQTNRFAARQKIIIKGRSNVSNLELVFYPYGLLQSLVSNRWPSQLKFHDRPLKTSPEDLFASPVRLRGTGRLHAYLIMSAFTHYYASIESLIESKYGKNKKKRPNICNFGRVIRNAFAHGGRIYFENQNAKPVTWLNLTYTPKHNGQEIIYRDISPVEMILLMEDMDSVL